MEIEKTDGDPISEKYLLKDLKSLISDGLKKFNEEYASKNYQDIELTDEFKSAYSRYLSSKRGSIEFAKYTAKATLFATSTSNLDVYIPNTLFVISTYVLDVYNELDKYKFYFIEISEELGKDIDEYAQILYDSTGDNNKDEFLSGALKVFRKHSISENVTNDAAEKMWSFVSNHYSQWAINSSKKINRQDFRISTILSMLNVVNADQGYIAKIVDSYATDSDLKRIVSSPDNLIVSSVSTGKKSVPGVPLKTGRNIVVYGTPGCGKSYYVMTELLNEFSEDNIFRTTFYPDYSNTDFIGQILPVVTSDGAVSYEFNPGLFTLALEKAYANPEQNIALVIEELNRGNAAGIFSDIFQLLDRDSSGTSIYPIKNKRIQDYLGKHGIVTDKVVLPSNLSIFATMNTSDQNVFTLDTAFKRRWEFIKIKNSFENHRFASYYIPCLHAGGKRITWQMFVEAINEFIISNRNIFKSEDKQIGTYFVSSDLLLKEETAESETAAKGFAYKIFEYLWDDVFKNNHEDIFIKDIRTLDELIERFVSGGQVFTDEFIRRLCNN